MYSKQRRVALVVGTRPECIKMAPVWLALRHSRSLSPILVSTGQHRQMLDQAFGVFGLKPDIDLGLMQQGQTLPDLTARVLTAMTTVLREHRPAAVLVQGDTTTVLGTALAAFYERIPIGHVEAGLRTYDFEAPWPEEMNRRLADPISRWCFAPTEWSAANLKAERTPGANIHVTGNTVVDALLWVREKLKRTGLTAAQVIERCQIPADFAARYLKDGPNNQSPITSNVTGASRWVLITGHRRESFGGGFENICHAIGQIAAKYPDVGLLYPVHLNPNVQEPVRRILGGNPRVALIPPVGYEDFIWLMDRCHFVLSDSGGVQEEAPSLGKPVLVMRTTTERPEGVDAGTCRLVGTSPDVIMREASALLDDEAEYARRSRLKNPYGDGTAAYRIAEILAKDLST
ncbi:UDP-N-acetylglucosamine 2-epimerase (non-hydrolyzing) [Opitutus sp. ER46]|uniref:non-hydrolyzing UDP-N-acetylglucosamine 2-epimerase n=1 Tax=Opitutus sp. ER46 TaxID=2161864 RepID=UPI0018EE6DDB|nr:UDP-N-acetylglucosamine 2-epimerase (non-hydrolyzing) [Opitutus sp. ER46]